jgi:predicted ATP-binding protein involved in virulence
MEKVDIRLDKLVLRNYKGFYTGDDENGVEITFDKNLTVFIGDNGSGKSAVLDAIALFLGKLRAKITEKSIHPYTEVPKSDLTWNKDVNNRDDVESSFLNVVFKVSPIPKDIVKIDTTENKSIYDTKSITEFSEEYEEVERSPKVGLSAYLEKDLSPTNIRFHQWDNHSQNIKPKPDGDDEKTLEVAIKDITELPVSIIDNIPVMAYYGANSIHTNETVIVDKGRDNIIFDSYENALDANTFDYKSFHNWFFDEQLKDGMRRKKGVSGNSAKSLVKIPFITEAIKGMFEDEGIEYDNLEMNFFRKPYELYITKNYSKKIENLDKLEEGLNENKPLAFSQLSSGERTLIALVADLTRRLCLANPNAKNPLDGNGIVLIDEIDVHLHPKWQQKVVTRLREVFPNIQFVVTTHSPEVLKGLDRRHLRIVKNNSVTSNVPHIKGRDNNAILQDAFGIYERLPEYEEKLSQFYKYVESDKKQARKILDELTSDWGEMDTEIIRAESYFEIF